MNLFCIIAIIYIAVICVGVVLGEKVLTYMAQRSKKVEAWCEKHIYNYDLMEE